MIKMSHIVTALLLASVAVAHAETTNQPAAQGAASVDKNLSKNPDNKGLQNAAEKTKENEAKNAAKHGDTDKKDADKKSDEAKHKKDKDDKKDKDGKKEHMEKHDHDKAEHHEKAERPAKVERPGK